MGVVSGDASLSRASSLAAAARLQKCHRDSHSGRARLISHLTKLNAVGVAGRIESWFKTGSCGCSRLESSWADPRVTRDGSGLRVGVNAVIDRGLGASLSQWARTQEAIA